MYLLLLKAADKIYLFDIVICDECLFLQIMIRCFAYCRELNINIFYLSYVSESLYTYYVVYSKSYMFIYVSIVTEIKYFRLYFICIYSK